MRLIEHAPSWFDPAETVWLQANDRLKKEQYREKIAHGASYLIREVKVAAPGYPGPHSVLDIGRILYLAEREFHYLQEAGLRVPQIDWYSRQKPEGDKIAVIARVPVIEGVNLPPDESRDSDIEALRQDCANRIGTYYDYERAHRRNAVLEHMGAYQCIYGHERASTGSAQTPALDVFNMIDIDPELF